MIEYMKKIFTFFQVVGFISIFLFTPNILRAQDCTVNAGVPITWCPGETMTLYGNVAGNYNGSSVTWSQLSGPVVIIANPHSLTTDCGTAVAGATYVFSIQAQCQDNSIVSDQVTYTVVANTPTPPATSAGSTINAGCKSWGQSIGLNATPAPAGFSGTWSIVGGGTGYFDNPSNPTAQFIPTQMYQGNPFWSCPGNTNSYVLKWTLVSTIPPDPQCANSQTSTSANVTVNAAMYNDPVNANVVIPGCGNQTTNVYLYGSCHGLSTPEWSLVSGPAGYTFTPAGTRDVILPSLPSGSYTFRYSVTGACITGYKDVTFTVVLGANYAVTSSNANAGGIQTAFCSTLPSSLQLSANMPGTGETGTWAQTGGGATLTFSDINDPNAVVSGITQAGSPYTLVWVITGNLGCSSTSSLQIRYIPMLSKPPINLTTPCNQPTYTGGGAGSCSYTLRSMPMGNAIYNGFPVGGGWYIKGFMLNSKPQGSPATIGFSSSQTVVLNAYSEGTHISHVGDCAGPGFFFTFSWSSGTSSAIGMYCHQPYVPGVYKGYITWINSYCGSEFNQDFTFNITHDPTTSNAGTDQNLACALTQTFLAGNDPMVTSPYYGQGVWEQLSGPNTAVIANPLNRSSQISSLVPGTYKFIWRITSGDDCPAKQDTVVVRVSDVAPSPVSAGPDQSVCYGTPVNLTADLNPSGNLSNMLSATGSSGVWSINGGSPPGAVITAQNDLKATVDGLIANSVYVFRYTASNMCGSEYGEVTITTGSTQGPAQADAGTGGCLAAGTTTFSLVAVPPSFGSVTWSKLNPTDPGTITNPSASTTTVTGVTPNGVYGYVLTVDAPSCSPTYDTVYFSNTGTLSAASAGADQDICADLSVSTFSLSAVAPTNGTGSWSQMSGPVGAVFNPLINNPVVTVLNDGQYVFRWTISNGACPNNTDDVIVNFYRRPSLAVVLTPDTAICAGSAGTLLLRAVAPVQGWGAWSVMTNGPGSVLNPSNPQTNATLRAGSTRLRWTVASPSSACPSTFDEVDVTYTPAANAKNDQVLCEASSVVLNSSNPGAGTGSWSVVSQPAGSPSVVFSSQGTDSTWSASPLSQGVYTFRWTVIDALCGTSTDDVDITIDALPDPPYAGADFCAVTGYPIALSGNSIPSGATGTWTRFSAPTGSLDGTITNPNSANASYNITPYTPTNYRPGIYNFRYRFTSGGCTSDDYVAVRAVTKATAGTDQSDCNRLTPFTLAGSVPVSTAGEVGTWTVLAGTPSVTNLNLYNSSITVPVGDSVSLMWKIAGEEGCFSNSDTVALVNRQVFAGNNQILSCIIIPGGSVTMAATGTGTWSAVAGNPGTAVIDQLTNPVTAVHGFTAPGTYHFRWTNAGCFDDVDIEVTGKPAGGTDQSDLCVPAFPGGSVNMAATGTGTWSERPGNPGSSDIAVPSAPTTTISNFTAAGTYGYLFSESGCADTVLVNIQEAETDLGITKISSSATPLIGSVITFTLTATNTGACPASGVTVTDALPSGYTLLSATPSSGSWADPVWTIGNLPVGGTVTLTMEATVLSSGDYANTAIISGFGIDVNSSNDEATNTPNPVLYTDLEVEKTVNIADPSVGATVVFTITATNLGPANATGVVVTDHIPSGFNVLNVSPQSGTSWNAPHWQIGNLTASSAVVLTITAVVLPHGPYVNIATLTANETELQYGNNTDEAELCVRPSLTMGSTSGSTCGTMPVTVSGNTFGGSATEYTITHNGTGTLVFPAGTRSPFTFSYGPGAGDAGNTVTFNLETNNPDGSPCVPATATYTLDVFPAPTRTYTSSDVTCFGSNNGTITIQTTGGTPPYQYSLNNGFSYNYSSPGSPFTITHLSPGNYQVRVKDDHGCETVICQ